MKRTLLLLCCFGCIYFPAFSQTATLYSTDFSTGSALPTGWTTASTVITASAVNPSTGYPAPSTRTASGSGNLLFSNTATGDQQVVINPSISTVGFTSITVSWGASFNAGTSFPQDLILEWSLNGTNWNVQNYSNIPADDGSWYEITPTVLPIGASGQTNLQFRLTFTGDNNTGTYRIDDFIVIGTGTGTFYSKSTGDLNNLATWGTNLDGTGSQPSSFTANLQTFSIRNNPTPTITGVWTVGGTATSVIVENGSNFTVPAAFSFNTINGAVISVQDGGTLTLNNGTMPTFGTLGANSTVVYGAAQNVVAVTGGYGNLTISNFTANMLTSIRVNGALTLNQQLVIGNGNTLTLNGTLAGASTLRGSNSSPFPNITINGTGDLGGTLRLGVGSASGLGALVINRTTNGLVTLGSNIRVNGQLSLNNGILALNDRALTFDNNSSISSAGGSFRGSASANISITGSGNAGTLVFDQTGGEINRTLNSLTTNRTLTLGSDLTISNTLTLNNPFENFSIGANTLTLNGPSVAGSTNSFLTSSSSSLIFGGSQSPILIPTGANNLNNLTINNPSGVILNSNMTVNGTLTLTSGNFNITTFFVTLNGAVAGTGGTFLAQSSSKVLYNQSSTGQSVIAANYGNLDFNNFNKILPTGIVGVSGIFTPGTATGHTVTGSTFDYNGSANQSIGAFNYNNLSIDGSNRNITFPNGGTIGIAGTFTPNVQNFTVTNSTVSFNGSGNQTIPAGINYFNLRTAMGGTKTFAADLTVTTDLTIGANTTLNTSGSGFNLSLGRNLTNNGIFIANTGTVTLNGTDGQLISGNTLDLNNLTTQNTSGSGVSIDANVNLKGAFTATASGCAIDLDGPSGNRIFTLISDASGDARIAAVPTGANISGQVVVQRFLANPIASRKYRYLASPVTNATVADWQNEIPITGTFADPSTGTYDGTTLNTGNPSLFYYNETQGSVGKNKDEGYIAYPASGTAASNGLNNGTGYAIFVRKSSASTPTVTLDLKGNPRIGTTNLPFSFTSTSQGSSEDGWNLLGNPFPAPINWSSLSLPGSLDGTVYVKSNVGVNGTTPDTYVYYNPGTGGVPAFFTGQIASGQAFFIKANASGTLSIPESAKTTSAILYKIQGPNNKLRIALKGTDSYDETLICFLDDATDKFDSKFDAYKLETGLATFSVTGDTTKLAINALSQVTCSKDLGVSVELNGKGTYTLKFSEFENFTGAGIRLRDNFADKTVDVKKDSIYTFIVTDDANSKGKNRFRLVFEKSSIKPVITQTGYYLLNSDSKTGNQWLKNGQPIAGATGTTYLPTEDGNYSVQVTTTDGCKAISDEIVMKITALDKFTDAGMKIYPNPVTEDISLELSEVSGKNLTVTVYSVNGTEVSNQTLSANKGKSGFAIKTRNLASGLYILKVADGNKVRVIKFVKE